MFARIVALIETYTVQSFEMVARRKFKLNFPRKKSPKSRNKVCHLKWGHRRTVSNDFVWAESETVHWACTNETYPTKERKFKVAKLSSFIHWLPSTSVIAFVQDFVFFSRFFFKLPIYKRQNGFRIFHLLIANLWSMHNYNKT